MAIAVTSFDVVMFLALPIDEATGETSVVVDEDTEVSDPPVLPLLAQAAAKASNAIVVET